MCLGGFFWRGTRTHLRTHGSRGGGGGKRRKRREKREELKHTHGPMAAESGEKEAGERGS
jgi:hypothetical protein